MVYLNEETVQIFFKHCIITLIKLKTSNVQYVYHIYILKFKIINKMSYLNFAVCHVKTYCGLKRWISHFILPLYFIIYNMVVHYRNKRVKEIILPEKYSST